MVYCIVVEDNHISCEVLDEHMYTMGIEHQVIDNAKHALEACMKRMPDVVILDWHMPEMDGVEFAKALRAMPHGGVPKIIICTCDEGAKFEPEIKALNASAFLTKPTYFSEIKRVFEELNL